MINLKHPKMVAFLDKVTDKKIKMGIDSHTGRTKLLIVDQGEILGWHPDTSVAPTPTNLSDKVQEGIQFLSRTETSWGMPTSQIIEFTRDPKCYSFCDAGIALEIEPEVERPGFDSEIMNMWRRFYTGEVNMPVLDAQNRYSIEDLDTMIKMMIDQMAGDFKDLPEKDDYLLSKMYSPAIARKMYKVKGLAAGDIIKINGADFTISPNDLTDIVADHGDIVFVNIDGNAGDTYIVAKDDFKNFTATTDVVTGILTPCLWVRSNSAYIKLNFLNHRGEIEVRLFRIMDAALALGLGLSDYEGDPYKSDGEGQYPVYTPQRINELFREWNGSVFPLSDLVLARKGEKYVVYEIAADNSVPNLHGASHKNGYTQRLMIIVSLVDDTTYVWDITKGWDAFKEAATANQDANLQSLLGAFSGTRMSGWK
jgi:hypothetical protein